MSDATLENLKSRRLSSGWEVRLSEDLPTPTHLAALKRKKNGCKTTIVTQHPRQAFPSLQQPLFASATSTESTVQTYSSRWDTKPQWGANQCFPPSHTGSPRWMSGVQGCEAMGKYGQLLTVQTSVRHRKIPSGSKFPWVFLRKQMLSSGKPNKGNTPHLDASKLHKIANIRGFPKSYKHRNTFFNKFMNKHVESLNYPSPSLINLSATYYLPIGLSPN